MDIVYDAMKNNANVSKHRVALSEASLFEWDAALCWDDERIDYGEVRRCAIGYIGHRLYFLVYVLRDDVCRIISLRKANSREVKRYAET